MLANANPTEDAPIGKHRLSSPERRRAIIETAMELFAKNGFRGTTTRELASAVGVSEPVLYQHFATKGDLYTAIVDQMVEETIRDFAGNLQELADSQSNDREFFECLGEMVLRWYQGDPKRIRLLLFSSLEGHQFAEIWHEKATKEFTRFVGEYVARRKDTGAFRVDDAEVAAKAFIFLVAHLGLVSAIFKCPLPNVAPNEVLRQFVDIYLHGVQGTRLEGEVR
jgi:TetR/AcrR family transcriptional regulator